MAWGGSGGQVDQIQKTGKSTTERAIQADKHNRGWFGGWKKIPAKAAKGSLVEKLTIHSNKDPKNTVDLTGGFARLEYHESLLQDSIRAIVYFGDTGNSTNNQKSGTNCKNTSSVVDGLPITGSEKVVIKIKDYQKTELELELYVNQVRNINKSTLEADTALDLSSIEYMRNEQVRLETCFKGKISEHVRKILKDKKLLNTKKGIFIEKTALKNYNFIGNKNKPFYSINELCTKAVPNTPQSGGNTAGFLFFETYTGYHFKSIDKLMSQRNKLSIIYTGTPGDKIPSGYNVKAFEFEEDNVINVQQKLMMGGFSTGCITFNQRNCDFTINYLKSSEQQKYYELGGAGLNVWNDELTEDIGFEDASRFTFLAKDEGSLPDGKSTDQQIEQSDEPNFDASRIFNQAIMRYNTLFASTNTVTIPGDFSLHAGDIVFIDSPSLKADPKTNEVDKQTGGKYLVVDLVHLLTPNGTWTKMNVVRDSFGRKGNPTERTATGSEIIQNKSTDKYRIDPGGI